MYLYTSSPYLFHYARVAGGDFSRGRERGWRYGRRGELGLRPGRRGGGLAAGAARAAVALDRFERHLAGGPAK